MSKSEPEYKKRLVRTQLIETFLTSSGPPDYHDLPPLTPRCSRHSALARRSSKEELAMVNINNFPSVGDLR